MMKIRTITGVALASLVAAAAPAAAGTGCSAVMDWNQRALGATVTANQGAVPQIRSMAIVHASMHDAAAIAAAVYALDQLFQSQGRAGTLGASLAACGLTSEDPGVAVGQATSARRTRPARAWDGRGRDSCSTTRSTIDAREACTAGAGLPRPRETLVT